eukprot:352231-Chlamydomonas_euryale.AAC.6
MSTLPNASKGVLEYLFGPPRPRARVPSPWPSMTRPTFFTRTPVPGKPPGAQQEKEEPPEAAKAAEPGTEVTRDPGSEPAPAPAAECGEAPWATPGLRSQVLRLRLRRRWCGVTTATYNNLSAGCFGLSSSVKNMDSACFGCHLNFHNSRKPPADSD